MPPNTNSKVSFAKATLPFPIFAAEFDPYNRGYLIVGGGGGEGRSGVPNQISVLDISQRASIERVLDIELSREEDSAVSLASLATPDGLVVYAGINSSEKDQDAGKNEHLRSFDVRYPPRKKQKTADADKPATGSWKLLGKRSLFTSAAGPKKETYQRLLRLSPAHRSESGSKRIGAIATGLARESEIIVFNATNPTPDPADILTKIKLPKNAEANDLDLASPSSSDFSLAYCTDYDLYEQTFQYDFVEKKTERLPNGPRRFWHMPAPQPSATSPTSAKPKLRCVRFLDSQNVIALSNRPGQSGCELRIVHLYPTGPGMEMAQMNLPKRMKQATSMDVCALDADKAGNRQFVIAVAGQDISIEIYTTTFQQMSETFTALRRFMTLKDVHEHQMTKVCFTPFHPSRPQTSSGEHPKSVAPADSQYIRLASTSYGNTVVVDTIPVDPLDPQDPASRHVLSSEDSWVLWVLIGVLTLLVLAFTAQSFLGGFSGENQGGVFNLLPQKMRDFLDRPGVAAYRHGRRGKWVSVTPDASDNSATKLLSTTRLRELLSAHPFPAASTSPSDQGHAIIVRSSPGSNADVSAADDLDFAMHDDKAAYRVRDPQAKHWHELQPHEQARWRERLVRAGEWIEGETEKVLLGVLFSEYAQVVGGVAQEVVRDEL